MKKTILLIMFMLINANGIAVTNDTSLGTNDTSGTNGTESDSEKGLENASANGIVSDSETGLQ